MSASERIRALVEGFFEDMDPYGYEAPEEVIRALPEIVAVVEAAERLKDAERAKDVQRLVTAGLAIGEALRALDVKLANK